MNNSDSQQQSEQQRQQRQRQQRQLLRRLRSRWSHWHRSRPETQRQLSQQSELRRRNLDDGEDETVENFRSRRGMYIKHFNKTFSRGYENSNILSKIFKRNNTISTLMIFYRPWWTRRMSFYNEYVFQDLMNGLRRNSYLSRLYIDGMLLSTSIESLSNMLSSNFSIKEFTLKLRDRLIGDGITFWKPWKPFCNALLRNRTITDLELAIDFFTAAMMIEFAKVIKDKFCSIDSLRLHKIPPFRQKRAIRSLGDALEVNSSIYTLDLRDNNLDDDDVEILCEALKKNKNVKRFLLDKNKLTDRSVYNLISLLKMKPPYTVVASGEEIDNPTMNDLFLISIHDNENLTPTGIDVLVGLYTELQQLYINQPVLLFINGISTGISNQLMHQQLQRRRRQQQSQQQSQYQSQSQYQYQQQLAVLQNQLKQYEGPPKQERSKRDQFIAKKTIRQLIENPYSKKFYTDFKIRQEKVQEQSKQTAIKYYVDFQSEYMNDTMEQQNQKQNQNQNQRIYFNTRQEAQKYANNKIVQPGTFDLIKNKETISGMIIEHPKYKGIPNQKKQSILRNYQQSYIRKVNPFMIPKPKVVPKKKGKIFKKPEKPEIFGLLGKSYSTTTRKRKRQQQQQQEQQEQQQQKSKQTKTGTQKQKQMQIQQKPQKQKQMQIQQPQKQKQQRKTKRMKTSQATDTEISHFRKLLEQLNQTNSKMKLKSALEDIDLLNRGYKTKDQIKRIKSQIQRKANQNIKQGNSLFDGISDRELVQSIKEYEDYIEDDSVDSLYQQIKNPIISKDNQHELDLQSYKSIYVKGFYIDPETGKKQSLEKISKKDTKSQKYEKDDFFMNKQQVQAEIKSVEQQMILHQQFPDIPKTQAQQFENRIKKLNLILDRFKYFQRNKIIKQIAKINKEMEPFELAFLEHSENYSSDKSDKVKRLREQLHNLDKKKNTKQLGMYYEKSRTRSSGPGDLIIYDKQRKELETIYEKSQIQMDRIIEERKLKPR